MFGTRRDYQLNLVEDNSDFVDDYVDEKYWSKMDQIENMISKIRYHEAIIAQYKSEIASLLGREKQISLREKWIASQEQSIHRIAKDLKMAKHRLASEFPTGPRW